jgi:hypothetical protein
VLEIAGLSPPSDGQLIYSSSTLAVVQRHRFISQPGLLTDQLAK